MEVFEAFSVGTDFGNTSRILQWVLLKMNECEMKFASTSGSWSDFLLSIFSCLTKILKACLFQSNQIYASKITYTHDAMPYINSIIWIHGEYVLLKSLPTEIEKVLL